MCWRSFWVGAAAVFVVSAAATVAIGAFIRVGNGPEDAQTSADEMPQRARRAGL